MNKYPKNKLTRKWMEKSISSTTSQVWTNRVSYLANILWSKKRGEIGREERMFKNLYKHEQQTDGPSNFGSSLKRCINTL